MLFNSGFDALFHCFPLTSPNAAFRILTSLFCYSIHTSKLFQPTSLQRINKVVPNSFADLGQWVNNIGCLLGAATPSRSTGVSHHKSSEKTNSSWNCQADVPFQPAGRLRLLSGVHLAEGDTNWWPYPCTLCFIPSHVLWCISCLRVCWLKGLGPFLRCSCRGVGSWWDSHANRACPDHLGRVSEEMAARVEALSFWTNTLRSRMVVFQSW